MKKNTYFLLLLFFAVFTFVSCEKPEELYYQEMPEEGFYLVGTAVNVDSANMASLLKSSTIHNQEGKEVTREGFYSKFVFITASSQGFAVKQQEGTELISWGGTFALVEGETNVWKASIVKEAANFTVPEDGLYFLAVDMNLLEVYLFKISSWYANGTALVGTSFELAQTSTSIDSTNWSISNISLKSGKLRFRFYDIDSFPISGDSVNIVTYIGSSLTVPVYGTTFAEFVLDGTANYNINLKYDPVNGFSGTNDLPPYDPRGEIWSLIGDAFFVDNILDGTPTAWNTDFDMVFDPTSDTLNQIYEFKYEGLNFRANREFKIRGNHEWAGLEMGYNQVNFITGDAANIVNAGGQYGNFKTVLAATYDVTFIYNVKTNKKTLDFKPTSKK